MPHTFNVRVYGIFINEKNEILVTDEYINKVKFTKFPGGGLEYGEGTRECLKREWQEELNQTIEVGDHLYTTDFFQISAFGDERQIISIYYYVKPSSPFVVEFKTRQFDFGILEDDAQIFRWIPMDLFSEASVTFPIDKKVAGLLKA